MGFLVKIGLLGTIDSCIALSFFVDSINYALSMMNSDIGIADLPNLWAETWLNVPKIPQQSE